MRKWMIEFLWNFDNRGLKIGRVNSILITKSIYLVIYFNSIRCWGPLGSSAIIRAQSINREVNAFSNKSTLRLPGSFPF